MMYKSFWVIRGKEGKYNNYIHSKIFLKVKLMQKFFNTFLNIKLGCTY